MSQNIAAPGGEYQEAFAGVDSTSRLLLINFVSGGGIRQFIDYLEKQLRVSGIEYEYVETRSIRALLSLCRTDSTVVFCVNNLRIYLLLLLLPRLSPTLLLHDHKPRVGASWVERAQIACARLFARRFRRIVVHAADERWSRERNVRIAIPTPFFAPAFPLEDRVRVLFFGRIEVYKNLPFLVALAAQTRQTTEYVVVGSGTIAPDLKARIRSAGNISVLNTYVEDRLVELFFDWCDYLVLPYSDMTASGMVDMAGYFSKPVILSNIPGFERYFDKGLGICLDLSDPGAAAERIRGLPRRGTLEYRTMADASRANYSEAVGLWSRYVNSMLETDRSRAT